MLAAAAPIVPFPAGGATLLLGLFLNSITIHVMLSVPMPADPATSVAHILSSSYSTIKDSFGFSRGFLNLPILLLTNDTASYEVMQSQIPSHATIMNSCPGVIYSTLTSGNAVTIYSEGFLD